MLASIRRRHVVTGSPAAVDNAGRCVVARPDVLFAPIVSAWHDAAGYEDRQRKDHESERGPE
jgi:hypothetical protein